MERQGAAALASRAYWAAREAEPAVRAQVYRARREAFVARLRALAAWYRVPLELDVAPDVRLGRHLTVELTPGVPSRVVLESQAHLGDYVQLLLRGGSVHLAALAAVRHHGVLSISGDLAMAPEATLGWYGAIHCAERVQIGARAGFADRVTLSDCSHFFTEPDVWWYHNTATAPLIIGANTWTASNSVVTKGVTIGDYSITAAGSVVVKDVPPGHFASGVPARNKKMTLPWEKALAAARAGSAA